jgi:arabinose-5-phosphate isomerase
MNPESVLTIVRDALHWESQCIQEVAARLSPAVAEMVAALQHCRGRIVLTGMGKMGHVARKAAATFASTGTPAYFLHPSEALHGDLGMVARDDFLIALSHSGETDEILGLLPHIRRQGIPVMALTGNPRSRLAHLSQFTVDLSIPHEADQISEAPTASTTVALAMCDALAVALLRVRGFTREQFAIFHPSGFLGKKMLTTVADAMHRGDQIPLATPETPLREGLMTMTQKSLGVVFIVNPAGELLGVFTDGDLRRSLAVAENPLTEPLGKLMTKNPKFVTAELLAAEALALMERHAITVVPVVDAQHHPIGALHLHRLVQMGLA